jgi:hypothetical protein
MPILSQKLHFFKNLNKSSAFTFTADHSLVTTRQLGISWSTLQLDNWTTRSQMNNRLTDHWLSTNQTSDKTTYTISSPPFHRIYKVGSDKELTVFIFRGKDIHCTRAELLPAHSWWLMSVQCSGTAKILLRFHVVILETDPNLVKLVGIGEWEQPGTQKC